MYTYSNLPVVNSINMMKPVKISIFSPRKNFCDMSENASLRQIRLSFEKPA